ncbi:uncharacterized protein LOC119103586 [Pollicipes pollicipes]|uniref:uncharacterized protein LOC119103586 n=1 Tax=Pollicipes pollicipes TaxID=41117 RepID=UPI00188499BC|nr:uncharacterized protein LOC119103586 [Pollicipes pollicipes]
MWSRARPQRWLPATVVLCAALGVASALERNFWDPEPGYMPVRAATNTSRAARARRQADLALAIPDGAVIGILPKFGWLLYEGSSHEELDFRLETEFLYRFPRSRPSQVGLERTDEAHATGNYWEAPHILERKRREVRDSRIVRDKKMIYKGLTSMFRRFGMEGKTCLMKTICEISSSPLLFDGLVGELLNIALIPSHKLGDGPGLDEYRDAEKHGLAGGDCEAAFPACPISMFRSRKLV